MSYREKSKGQGQRARNSLSSLLLFKSCDHSLLTDHASPGFACVRMRAGQHRGRGRKDTDSENHLRTKYLIAKIEGKGVSYAKTHKINSSPLLADLGVKRDIGFSNS